MTREELIEALEKADGPSTKLDKEIHRCLKIPLNKYAVPDGYEDYGPGGDIRYAPNEYTASIDAATTLVPKEFERWGVDRVLTPIRINKKTTHSYEAYLSNGTHHDIGTKPFRSFLCSAKHPAIALCIAAIKAGGENK